MAHSGTISREKRDPLVTLSGTSFGAAAGAFALLLLSSCGPISEFPFGESADSADFDGPAGTAAGGGGVEGIAIGGGIQGVLSLSRGALLMPLPHADSGSVSRGTKV